MKSRIFEFLEHTSDLFVRIYADSVESLIRNCVYTFPRLVLDHPDGIPDFTRSLDLKGDTPEEMVLDLFSELIVVLDSENVLISNLDSLSGSMDDGFTAILSGFHLKGDEEYSNVIKAATRHELRYYEEDGFLTVLFDL
ncbi:MAG: archease [Candidatus Thermoplasmatota archaeon]|nr:archease [Candidatus Thermoplasmatota archaeon]